MAQATKGKPVTMAKAPAGAFKIETGVAVPPRAKDVPEYGIPFDQMKKGASMVIPYSAVPKEHARLLVMRWAREEKLSVATRTEKQDGEEVGLRFWHNGPATEKADA